jgi:hypothetical protein
MRAIRAFAFCLLGLAGAGRAAVNGPRSVLAACGDVAIRIDGPKLWTISRIDFRGVPLSTENSAYGTVLSFPGAGIIGSGHLDKGKEDVTRLEFLVDGKPVESPPERVNCRSFELKRRSRIREFALQGSVAVRQDRLYEQVTISSGAPVALDFLYNFMHAWLPTVSDFVAENEGSGIVRGHLPDEEQFQREFFVKQQLKWIAIYLQSLHKGAVSVLLERPAAGGAEALIWNVPPYYRKFYLKSFTGQTPPANFRGTYRMVTGFFDAQPDDWEAAARTLAEALRP